MEATLNDERILDCGHKPSPHGEHTTGTGHIDGRELCVNCCNSHEAAEFSKAQHYCAYLSGDGKTITTWPGGVLAQVVKLWSVHNNMAGEILRIRAVDASGNKWHGTSPGRGMYCRLHRSKV